MFQMVDANQRWSIDEAIDWMIPLAKYNLKWIEEPTSPDDILGHARISQVGLLLLAITTTTSLLYYCYQYYSSLLPFSERLLIATRCRHGFGPWTLVHPASNWTHLATLRRHPCLSRAATSASFQVNFIFCKSLLAVLLQFALGRPGPLLYPGTCQYSLCLLWYALMVHMQNMSKPT